MRVRSRSRCPRVSVVLPVGNAVRTLARAVESMRAQTFAGWEMIVVDDGSTDGSREMLERLTRSDARIRVVAQPHRGIVVALNTGLAAVRGGLIARMDADDEAHPERLAEQVDFLERNPAVGLVGCLVEYGGDRRANAGYALHVDWINSLVSPEQIALNRFIESPFAHPSVVFRRALVERWGDYRDGVFPEDYELWLRWLDAGVRMAKVPRVLLNWNDPPGRLSRTDPRYDVEAFYRMKAEYLSREVTRLRQGRPVYVWGAGRPTRKRAAHLEAQGVRIVGYLDIDPRKIGRVLAGRAVLAPAQLPRPEEVFVLGYVASRGARDLIRTELTARGCLEGRDFLIGA